MGMHCKKKKVQNWFQIENCPQHTNSKSTKVLHLSVNKTECVFEDNQSWSKKEKNSKNCFIQSITKQIHL